MGLTLYLERDIQSTIPPPYTNDQEVSITKNIHIIPPQSLYKYDFN